MIFLTKHVHRISFLNNGVMTQITKIFCGSEWYRTSKQQINNKTKERFMKYTLGAFVDVTGER